MQRKPVHEEEWFAGWFDETYLALYSHRDTEEARQLVSWIARHHPDAAREGIVDLACGAGRHAWAMTQEYGWSVVGLDLSSEMIAKARLGEIVASRRPPCFVRGDLRHLPFADNQFGLAVNLFTSFGYFHSEQEHQQSLFEMYRILKPGGRLILDLLNRDPAITSLVSHDHGRVGKLEVEQHRTFDPTSQRLEKSITIGYPDGSSRQVLESIRLFSLEEAERMSAAAGFRVQDRIGSYSGTRYRAGESERMILIAGKE